MTIRAKLSKLNRLKVCVVSPLILFRKPSSKGITCLSRFSWLTHPLFHLTLCWAGASIACWVFWPTSQVKLQRFLFLLGFFDQKWQICFLLSRPLVAAVPWLVESKWVAQWLACPAYKRMRPHVGRRESEWSQKGVLPVTCCILIIVLAVIEIIPGSWKL